MKKASRAEGEAPNSWLLLIHQIPPKPGYLRVKIWRHLQKLGAVAIKNSVYALPVSESAQEDFQWVRKQIVAEGGDASVCEARFVDGLSDAQIIAIFEQARNAEYAEVGAEARKVLSKLRAKKGPLKPDKRAEVESDLGRLRKRLEQVGKVDFTGASGRVPVEGLLGEIEHRIGPEPTPQVETKADWKRQDLTGRVWVTRTGIHVDRIASAWLIRRFIDPRAQLKYVPAKGYEPEKGELRFDMFDAEFTHEGDRCTFEVLLDRLAIADRALRAIAEIVHDIDLKDGKFARPETPGIDSLILGVCLASKEDGVRLEQGSRIFETLYDYFQRKR
jgi:hypothetical protein